MILHRVTQVYRSQGAVGVLRAAIRRLRVPQAACFRTCREIVQQANGIEVGGPSPIFATLGLLPCYSFAGRIDNCNFAPVTIFDNSGYATARERASTGREGKLFAFCKGKAPGQQFIAEGTNLHMIPSGCYDFMLSSHMLEHTANPLGALAEWRRVLRPGGGLVLVVPHRDGTFDHRRPVTTMDHLARDCEDQVGEDDLTHVAEVLSLHDVAGDYGVTDAEAFRERVKKNTELRSIHHHVFDTQLAAAVVESAGFELIAVEPLLPYHIVVLARNASQHPPTRVSARLDLRDVLRASPFPTDREC